MYPGEAGPFIMTLGHDFWSNYLDPNGFVLGEYRDPGHTKADLLHCAIRLLSKNSYCLKN